MGSLDYDILTCSKTVFKSKTLFKSKTFEQTRAAKLCSKVALHLIVSNGTTHNPIREEIDR